MKSNSLLALFATTAFGVLAEPSAGCGKTPVVLKNGVNTVTTNGIPRQFNIRLPDGYNNKTPYRTIFVFHETGGTANRTSKTFDGLLKPAGDSSILVAPQGLGLTAPGGMATGILGGLVKGITGWWRTGGRYGEQDLEFVDDIIKALDVDLCIDTRRRFATGFSFGGVISYALGCLRGDKFRAVSMQSGANFDTIMEGMGRQNKGNGADGKNLPAAKPPGSCKKTDAFSQMYMGK
jgi:poly(3-hydroxybutyrate) depolymerase